MKKLLLAATILALLNGCTTSTTYGPCIGLADEKNPKLVYKVSAWNVFLAVVFLEFIYPPISVAMDSTFCPVGEKAQP